MTIASYPSMYLTHLEEAYPALDLTFIGTEPKHERRGAASLLIQWGLERCKRDNVPAYLESTANAGSLYERHGFKTVENISMVLEGAQGDAPVLYEEKCFLFQPSSTSYGTESSIHSVT